LKIALLYNYAIFNIFKVLLKRGLFKLKSLLFTRFN
jgi:hypothetical protein